mmetsp:Transcript_26010/g.39822  ORF Transcript_26010/g.39822 Transcript_26010/m.39822 type:complete len:115 (-) Transcript_26010:333-677(-)
MQKKKNKKTLRLLESTIRLERVFELILNYDKTNKADFNKQISFNALKSEMPTKEGCFTRAQFLELLIWMLHNRFYGELRDGDGNIMPIEDNKHFEIQKEMAQQIKQNKRRIISN